MRFLFQLGVALWLTGFPAGAMECPHLLWSAGQVDPLGDFPLVVGTVPVEHLFTRGHATLEMEPWMLEAFGPNGPGLRWMDHLPNGTHFTIPFSAEGQWHFAPKYAWGTNHALDNELLNVLAPLARRLASSVIEKMSAQLVDKKVVSNGNIVVVKNSYGLGAATWHQDHQWDSWDARAIGVMPFGVAPPTQAYFDKKAYTPPKGNLVVIESHTWHRGLPTPESPRAVITVDMKVN